MSTLPFNARHMIVIRLSAMGDVALTTGVLLHWHEVRGLTFTVLTKTAMAPLFDYHPAVRDVIALDPADLRGQRQQGVFRNLADQFRGVPLVDLHGTLRTRLLSLLWHGPVFHYPKLALARRMFLRSGGRLFQNALLRDNVPQRYMQALSPAPKSITMPSPRDLRPRFFLSPEENNVARNALASWRPAAMPSPLVALHPFATHSAKTWSLPVWLDFAARLKAHGIRFFWVGQGPQDFDPGFAVADFINKTTLRELIALIAQADALVTGDSGPMHLANGVDTPVLALFGPTCREWGFFPSGDHDRVLQIPLPCRPCSLHGKTTPSDATCPRNLACMTQLTPAAVAETLCEVLWEKEKSGEGDGVLFRTRTFHT